MRKIVTFLFLFMFLFICLTTSTAQTRKAIESDETFTEVNLVKINLAAFAANTFSVQYERAVAKKISVGLGLRLMPESGLPLKSFIKNLLDDEDAWEHLENLKVSNFAITPEARFYMGKSVFRGFYIAPFARYANYTAKMPFEFEYEDPIEGEVEEMIPLDGKITTFTGGVMFGAQWKLSKLVYLDWWILGPHYGTSNGDISGRKSLTFEEQMGLREALSDLDDLPFIKDQEVDASGARVGVKGPWGGIRAGVALCFRF